HPPLRLDLAAEVHEERAVRHVAHPHAVDAAQIFLELRAGGLVGTVHRDVPHVHGGSRLHEVDRTKAAAALADDGRHMREHPGAIGDLEAEYEAERGTQHGARRRIGHACQRIAVTGVAFSLRHAKRRVGVVMGPIVVMLMLIASLAAATPPSALAPLPTNATCVGSIGPGIAPRARVPNRLAGLHASWYGQSGYMSLCAGERATATVAYFNSGSRGWVSGRLGEVAYLGTWNSEPGQDQPSIIGGDGAVGSPATGWPRFN